MTRVPSFPLTLLAVESLTFTGHPAVRATHMSTFEVTKDKDLTAKGDCIIGVNASKACKDLSQEFKDAIRKDGCVVKISLRIGKMRDYEIWARGESRLSLEDDRSVVVRKSDYVCSRTLAVRADKAAAGLPRSLVSLIKNSRQPATMTAFVYELG